MKRKIITIAATILLPILAFSQTTSAEFAARYSRQVKNLGYAGVGVETILDKWDAAFPDDPGVLEGRFNLHLYRGLSTQVVPKPGQKTFMGGSPVLTLKDSTGTDVPYFEESFFEESEFSEALGYLDKGIALYPDDLTFRFDKATALIQYEKESPDLAYAELNSLLDYHVSAKPVWQASGMAVDAQTFASLMQDYCLNFYTIGSAQSYEYFFNLAKRLSKLYPDEAFFIDDQGVYYLVAKKNYRKAEKLFRKALKMDPADQVARANLRYIERHKKA